MEYTKIFKTSKLLQSLRQSQKKIAETQTLKTIPRRYMKPSAYLSFQENNNDGLFQSCDPYCRYEQDENSKSVLNKRLKKSFGKKVSQIDRLLDLKKALQKHKTIRKVRLSSFEIESLRNLGGSIIVPDEDYSRNYRYGRRNPTPMKFEALKTILKSVTDLTYLIHTSAHSAYKNLKYLTRIKSLQHLKIIIFNEGYYETGNEEKNNSLILKFQMNLLQMPSIKRFHFDSSQRNVGTLMLWDFLDKFAGCQIPEWYLRFQTTSNIQPIWIKEVLGEIDLLELNYGKPQGFDRYLNSRGYHSNDPPEVLELSNIAKQRKKILEISFELPQNESMSLLDFLQYCHKLEGLSVIDGKSLKLAKSKTEDTIENQDDEAVSEDRDCEIVTKKQEFAWLTNLKDLILYSSNSKESEVFKYLIKSLQSNKKDLQRLKIWTPENDRESFGERRGRYRRGEGKFRLDLSLFATLKGFPSLEEIEIVADQPWNVKSFKGFFMSRPKLTKLRLVLSLCSYPWDRYVPFECLDQLTELRIATNRNDYDSEAGNDFVKNLHRLYRLETLEVFENGRRGIGYLNKLIEGLSHLNRLKKVNVQIQIRNMDRIASQDLFCEPAQDLLKLVAETIVKDIKEKTQYIITSCPDLEELNIGSFKIPGFQCIRYQK